MEITFGDVVVESVDLNYTLTVSMAPSGEIRIEVPVTLEDAETVRVASVGEVDLTGDTTFDDLVGRSIVRAAASDDGRLTVEFAGGKRITASVRTGYESWEVAVQGGAMYFGGPEDETTFVPS